MLDLDRHCSVHLGSGQFCTRSLTCKSHTMSLKRAVEGRSKPFDTLVQEQKVEKEENGTALVGAPSVAVKPLSPSKVANASSSSYGSSSLPQKQHGNDYTMQDLASYEESYNSEMEDEATLLQEAAANHKPVPLASKNWSQLPVRRQESFFKMVDAIRPRIRRSYLVYVQEQAHTFCANTFFLSSGTPARCSGDRQRCRA